MHGARACMHGVCGHTMQECAMPSHESSDPCLTPEDAGQRGGVNVGYDAKSATLSECLLRAITHLRSKEQGPASVGWA